MCYELVKTILAGGHFINNRRLLAAFEVLSNPAKRRLYDSVDDFDDSVPMVCQANKDKFYEVFSPVVLANARYD